MAKPVAQGPVVVAGRPGVSNPPRGELSFVAQGTRVTGDIEASGSVKVEGTVVGSVRTPLQVLVAKGGVIEGDVLAREVIVGGEIHGGIHATERVEIQRDSVVNGNVVTRRVAIQEGADVNGHVEITGRRESLEGRARPLESQVDAVA